MNLCKSNMNAKLSSPNCPANRSLEVVDWQGAGSALQRTTPESVFRRWSRHFHTNRLKHTLYLGWLWSGRWTRVPRPLRQVSTDCGCWGSSTRPWSSCWSSSTAPGTAGATASASTSRRRATSLPSTPTAQPVQRSATGSETRLPVCCSAASRGRHANRPHLYFAIQEVCVRHVQLPGLQTPPASPVQAARGRRRRRAAQDSQVGGFFIFFIFCSCNKVSLSD